MWHHLTQASLPLKTGVAIEALVMRKTAVSQVQDHVSFIDSQTRRHVCCANLCVTRTERRAFLTFCFPRDGTSRSEENQTAHAAKFKQGKLNAFTNGISDL